VGFFRGSGMGHCENSGQSEASNDGGARGFAWAGAWPTAKVAIRR